MIIIEFILKIFGRIFVDIIADSIIIGFFKILVKIYNFIKSKIFGIKVIKLDKEKAEKKFLYKEIELTKNLNNSLKKGQRGIILELINEEKFYAEFYNKDGKKIQVKDKTVFRININQFKLKE